MWVCSKKKLQVSFSLSPLSSLSLHTLHQNRGDRRGAGGDAAPRSSSGSSGGGSPPTRPAPRRPPVSRKATMAARRAAVEVVVVVEGGGAGAGARGRWFGGDGTRRGRGGARRGRRGLRARRMGVDAVVRGHQGGAVVGSLHVLAGGAGDGGTAEWKGEVVGGEEKRNTPLRPQHRHTQPTTHTHSPIVRPRVRAPRYPFLAILAPAVAVGRGAIVAGRPRDHGRRRGVRLLALGRRRRHLLDLSFDAFGGRRRRRRVATVVAAHSTQRGRGRRRQPRPRPTRAPPPVQFVRDGQQHAGRRLHLVRGRHQGRGGWARLTTARLARRAQRGGWARRPPQGGRGRGVQEVGRREQARLGVAGLGRWVGRWVGRVGRVNS